MILIYRIITTIIFPVLITIIFIRKLLNKEDSERYKEKIFSSKFNVLKKKNSKLIWFHAASIGEIKSIIPIIKELRKNNERLEFLLTTVTLSSGNLIKNEIKDYDNIYHRYFPIDVEFLIKKFIISWKPSAIFLVDSEIWPNLIFQAKRLKIPLAIINARLTKRSFERWMMVPKSAKLIFSKFNLCLVSNNETKSYLSQLEAKNINYFGNIKLINNFENISSKDENINFLKEKKFWFAASTHKNEEKFCLDVHLELKKSFKQIFTIIAPRHIQRVNEIKKLCDNLNLKFQVVKKGEKIVDDKEIIIINSFGILPSYFKFAKSVLMGKSLFKNYGKVGGQNPIEAARLGCKIYHGPFIKNFEEIYKTLEENKIAKKIINKSELVEYLIQDLDNEEKEIEKYSSIMNNLSNKILSNTMAEINKLLKNAPI